MVALAHSAPYTVADLFAMPEDRDDTNRYEVIDGQLLVSPAPSMRHQRAADLIRTLVEDAAPAGVRAISAVAVRCGDEHTGLIPDVTVTTADLALTGAIDAAEVLAVVEVVSPSTRRTDRVTKPEVYASAGIATYWRVELAPFAAPGVCGEPPFVLEYRLGDDGYALAAHVSAGCIGELAAPYPVRLDPADLLS